MEVVEIVVYIGAAVLIAGMILGLLTSWDTKETYEDVRDIVMEEQRTDNLVIAIHDFWDSCGYGEIEKRMPLYVEGSGTFTKEDLFKELKKINYCNVLQSAENDCGFREDMEMPDLELPILVSLSCEDSKLKVGV